MFAHMQAVHTTKKGLISFGGVITSIVHAIGLERELATLDPLFIHSLDIDACLHMRLIKNRWGRRYSLMIGNMKVPSVVLPCPNRTDVQNRANWIYNPNAGIEARPVPMDIAENVNVDGATDDEYDHRERGSPVHEPPPHHSPHILDSPAHTTPFVSGSFAGTSSREAHIHSMTCFVRFRPRMPLMLDGRALLQPCTTNK